jgi:hypothetical protein
LSSEIVALPTKVIDNIASFTRSVLSVASAVSLSRERETVSLRTLEDMSIAIPRG